jgi:hypothetical protein
VPKKKTARVGPTATPPLRWKRDKSGAYVFDDGGEPALRSVDQQLADEWLKVPGSTYDVESASRAIINARDAVKHRRLTAQQTANATKAADASTVVRRDNRLGKLRAITDIKKNKPNLSDRAACHQYHIDNTPGWKAYSGDKRDKMLNSLATWFSKNRHLLEKP